MRFKSSHKENSKAWWDEKYSQSSDYLYGKEPSKYLLSHLDLLPAKAKVLEIACGEGRNAVALALKGFDVSATDFSAKAIERAESLAKNSDVKIAFKNADLDFFIPELMSLDAIVSIDFRPGPTLLKNLARGLKQGGLLLMEAHLIEACKDSESLEVFECFKPNELLQQFVPGQPSLRIADYSELDPGMKVQLVAKKTALL